MLHGDVPLLLFEVKLQHVTEVECGEQIDAYISWARYYLRQRVANIGQGGRPLWARLCAVQSALCIFSGMLIWTTSR